MPALAQNEAVRQTVKRLTTLIDIALNTPVGERVVDTLCMTSRTTSESQGYAWIGALPGMREWLGPRKFKELLAYDYAVKNREWESSLQLQKKAMEDDSIGMLSPVANSLVSKARRKPDNRLVDVINAAETSQCYDGQFFFDSDHVSGNSGPQSNLRTVDVTAAATPTPQEIRDIVDDMAVDMMLLKGDDGENFIDTVLDVEGTWTLCVPASYAKAVGKAYGQNLTGEDVGGTVVAVDNYSLIRPRVLPLTRMQANTIDLYYTGAEIKPYVHQERSDVEYQPKGMDDIEFKHVKMMTRSRFEIGYMAWFYASRAKLQTGS
ncbi:MAG: Mu-like prophage major head subunit gpT family protein [Planctomycetota bacterium]